jgi:hypothetical protein
LTAWGLYNDASNRGTLEKPLHCGNTCGAIRAVKAGKALIRKCHTKYGVEISDTAPYSRLYADLFKEGTTLWCIHTNMVKTQAAIDNLTLTE